jgi:rhomboid protease GluP
MFGRQRTGSVVCPSCGRLVGVNDKECLNCGRRNPGMWGMSSLMRGLGRDLGFVQLVIGASVLLYGAALLMDMGGIRNSGLSLLQPSGRALYALGGSGAFPVFGEGRWWTVLSAGWLHGGLLHILFNMLWIRQLAPETAELYGPGRMVILYTFSSATGFLLTSLVGAFTPFGGKFTLGASAALFGLLAALVVYGRRSGSSHVGNQAWTWALFLFIMGFLPGFGADNVAHVGGFGGGYLLASWLDPLRAERGDHILVAVACLAATALAVVASLLTARL